ncbi:hypothetical protein ACAG26_08165 [Mycobacterium sp. pUA109]|uniref:hypothetical protein n=1 Tax=Mycobacterium sp. pUA109 TaxID=3238982 RepID=UPI00351B1644
MWVRIAWLTLAATLAGCGAPAPTRPGAPAPSHASDQGPPGFPDLSTFTAVDPKPYLRLVLKSTHIGFTTPTLSCSWPYQDGGPIHYGASCTGVIPGMPDTAASKPEACDGIALAGDTAPVYRGVRTYTFVRGSGDCPAPPDQFRLTPGSKLSASSITCAVTQDGVACTDPIMNHGFVLSPAGSWSF